MLLEGKHIILGISGGIAAYKVLELIRLLRKEGAEVKTVVTANALQFVTEPTLRTLSGNAVYQDVFAAVNQHSTEHISLPLWADLMLVAPATANVLCKCAAGIADDALTTTFSATVKRCPVLVAPAMNDAMYANPATQQALNILKDRMNVCVIDSATGDLACGTQGKGRMQEVPVLLEAVVAALTPKTLQGKRVLITAGPTRENIDPVRFISNYSTGKMGYAIAAECMRRGADVCLVSGPVAIDIVSAENERLTVVCVQSASEMAQAAKEHWQGADIAVLSAAVADFTPLEVSSVKRKKQPGQKTMQLELCTTEDIAASLGAAKRNSQVLVGFALETNDELSNAQAKLKKKNFDFIVLNSLQDAGAGFGYDTNKVTLIHRSGDKQSLPLLSKQLTAAAIVNAISNIVV